MWRPGLRRADWTRGRVAQALHDADDAPQAGGGSRDAVNDPLTLTECHKLAYAALHL